MLDLGTATTAVKKHLEEVERTTNEYGSALPGYADHPKLHLVIIDVRSEEFGWVFFYDSKKHQETGDFRFSLAGNAPIIFDRHDGKLYSTGTAHPVEYYLEQYRAGARTLVALK